MNQAETPDTSQIIQWAPRQLADYDARNPGSLFADGVVLNVAQGYELQSAVAQLRRDRVDRLGAGQIILTGSIPSLISIDEDCRIRVEASPFGSVEVEFVA